ncbi:DUF1877 family protein [Cellulophaga sp. HaHa_2_95]|uniref:DUF1877 family protein n=1 Tax=Cellulophaga sp. HaHa_2_95 TaxID=2745558 RepID=UPI001C4E70CE|nr:DUF1877 family protein [Cellulophaga sp. HaHa_2_95]QXP55097.1 DUF1877 family protein [Cellulophaga sp. HaHa_2_95]
MGLDLALLAVPKEAENILKKAERKIDTEYSDIIFHLPRAFQDDFQDFGHSDWSEFKNDAQDLVKNYPEGNFDSKFYINTNRTYGVLDYLIAQRENVGINDSNSFFYDGIKFENCKSGQGFSLIYWDLNVLQKKKKILDSLSFEKLYTFYDFRKMIDEGVYKIEQVNENIEELQNVFIEVKKFLKYAIELKGYVLVLKS